jgi:DNA topoisomerase-1
MTTSSASPVLRWLLILLLVLSTGTVNTAAARGRRQTTTTSTRTATVDTSAEKFARVARFTGRFNTFRDRAQHVLASTRQQPRVTEEVALAAIATIMYKTSARVGSECYARRKPGEKVLPSGKVKKIRPSFGASSLRKEHVTVTGDTVRLRFWGKSGVWWDRTIQDADLARTVGLFMAQPGKRLWQVPNEKGRLSQITESHVGKLFAEYDAQPKDVRTMLANQRLDAALARLPRPTSKRQAEKNLRTSITGVAKFMGHRPSTCRKSYLEPARLERYAAGLQ